MFRMIATVKYWDEFYNCMMTKNFFLYCNNITEAAEKVEAYLGTENIEDAYFQYIGEEGTLLEVSDEFVEELKERLNDE